MPTFELMKPVMIVLMLLAVLGSGLRAPEKMTYEVSFLQNDELIYPEDGIVMLERAPFTICIKLYDHDGVYMNASFEDNLYQLKNGQEPPDFRFLPSKVMTELNFNEARQLMLTKDYWSYLFYDPALDWHRFDSVEVNGGNITGYKTVEELFDVDEDKKLKFKKAEDIYLFFMATEPYVKGNAPVEISRSKMKIMWQ